MKDTVKIVYQGGEGEIIEKKSRFIATVKPVNTEEEAIAFIEQMKKKYWDARHNCYAFSVGKEQEILRFSDDGEPGGTAGKPILEVITGQDLHNVAVVVTRYFGGTLLGTGGLVRAYTQATQAGLLDSVIVEQKLAKPLTITTDYTDIGKLQYLFAKEELDVINTTYESDVVVELLIPVAEIQRIQKQITEITSARAQIEAGEECYYFRYENECIIL